MFLLNSHFSCNFQLSPQCLFTFSAEVKEITRKGVSHGWSWRINRISETERVESEVMWSETRQNRSGEQERERESLHSESLTGGGGGEKLWTKDWPPVASHTYIIQILH